MEFIKQVLRYKDLVSWVLKLVELLKGFITSNPVPINTSTD